MSSSAKPPKFIEITGASTHNLKAISVSIPQGRMTVITGVSGSGKSSLAFDTLYAEGQRRFVESLSTYARQFIEKMARPDIESVRNLQPAIAIEQKNSVKNARSTIGTATEVSDYLRLIFAKRGDTHCAECGGIVREDTPQTVLHDLLAHYAGRRAIIIAPLARRSAVDHKLLRQELMRGGYVRLFTGAYDPDERLPGTDPAPAEPAKPARGRRKAAKKPRAKAAAAPAPAPQAPILDPRAWAALFPDPILDLDEATDEQAAAALNHAVIRVITDRVILNETERDRIATSLTAAFQMAHDRLEVRLPAGDAHAEEVHTFLSGFRCNTCGTSAPRPEPNLFSFNSPLGACAKCSGFGRVTGVDWEKVFPDKRKTLAEKPIAPFNTPSYRSNYRWVRKLSDALALPQDLPLEQFTQRQWKQLLYGEGKEEGVQAFFDWLEGEKYKVQSRILIARYRGFTKCPACDGTRLISAARHVMWTPRDGSLPPQNIAAVTRKCIAQLRREFESVTLAPAEEQAIGRAFREVLQRLVYLDRVGLGYLTLDRQTRTLSGGEAQRINLATALGTSLTQTLYVLDEPTVGLHPRDSHRLLAILHDLRAKGNTVVVVEHDPEIILGADHIIDLGPRAGSAGGEVVFAGTREHLLTDGSRSLTAQHLRASRTSAPPAAAPPKRTAAPSGPALIIRGAREHNLRDLTVTIPLRRWVCITGVSGSGKSTLVHSILYEGYNQYQRRAADEVGQFDSIEGFQHVSDVLLIDQSPIGRSIRSNPVTYVKAYDPIRKLYAATAEAKARGLTDSSFSFNVAGGRCEACEGTGVRTYDMHFLAEITLPCEECGGRRFQPRVLEVQYRGKNIDDLLSLTIDDACEFFRNQSAVTRRLQPLRDVGLGYLTLGQNTATLSGGEAQRLKLASFLAVSGSGPQPLMIFDEPTTGLHLADLEVLAGVFRRLVASGISLIVIEHNLEIIRQADWVLDLGPEGGDGGGRLVAEGTPADIAHASGSHTGRFLRELIGG